MENQLLDQDMMNSSSDAGKSLNELLTNGYETHSVDYIKKGLEIFKQNIGPFIGFILIVAIIQGIIGAIPYIKGLANAFIAPIAAGAYIVSKKIDKNEPHAFSDFFEGLQQYKDLFIVSIIPVLLIGAVTLVVGGWDYFKISFLGLKPPFDMNDFQSMMSEMRSYAGRGGMAGIIAMIIFILTMFGTFLVLFERFEPIRALDISRKIIGKKFFNWLGFLLLIGLFNVAGALCLLVGLLVTIPSSICAFYVAYEDVVGLNLRD